MVLNLKSELGTFDANQTHCIWSEMMRVCITLRVFKKFQRLVVSRNPVPPAGEGVGPNWSMRLQTALLAAGASREVRDIPLVLEMAEQTNSRPLTTPGPETGTILQQCSRGYGKT